jgi:hypothetical protein
MQKGIFYTLFYIDVILGASVTKAVFQNEMLRRVLQYKMHVKQKSTTVSLHVP